MLTTDTVLPCPSASVTCQPMVSPASSTGMAPISSWSSTWTSSGIRFSFVSMATGMGPFSSGRQATVASMVTNTFLVGLGFAAAASPPSPAPCGPYASPWPPQPPSRQEGTSVLATTEALVSSGPDDDTAPTKDGEGAEEVDKDEKSESGDSE